MLAVRVPRSWNSPHLIHKPGDNKWVCFYTRKDGFNRHLDWQEIRSSVVANETQRERIERFRNDRVGKIAANALGFTLADQSCLILHVVPVGSLGGEPVVDVEEVVEPKGMRIRSFRPMRGSVWDTRAALEGALTYVPRRDDGAYLSYAILFREGLIEAARCDLARRLEDSPNPVIASQAYEVNALKALKSYVHELKRIGTAPPVVVMLSACGVKGAVMGTFESWMGSRHGHPIDHDVIQLPPVILKSFEEPLDVVMKPAFDAMWNAAGHPRSLNYDSEDRWVGQERR